MAVTASTTTRVGACVVTAAGLAAVYSVNPNTTHVPLCPLHAMTGLWCPFCGSTRATYALLHADFATAIRDNVLFVAAVPFAILLAIRWLAGRRSIAVPKYAYPAALIVLVAFGIARNLPFGAGLAP